MVKPIKMSNVKITGDTGRKLVLVSIRQDNQLIVLSIPDFTMLMDIATTLIEEGAKVWPDEYRALDEEASRGNP